MPTQSYQKLKTENTFEKDVIEGIQKILQIYIKAARF